MAWWSVIETVHAAPSNNNNNNDNDDGTCRLYMAPSHLSHGETYKFGLYSGQALRKGELLPFSDIAIPIVDLMDGPLKGNELVHDVLSVLEQAVWTADYGGTANSKWMGNISTSHLIPGYGSLANYHAGISNIDFFQASNVKYHPTKDPLLLSSNKNDKQCCRSGVAHVSRGTSTPYRNVTVQATQDIPAGMELFANYGNVWDSLVGGSATALANKVGKDADSLEVNPNLDVFEQTLTRQDYADADQVLEKVLAYMKRFEKDFQKKKKGAELQEDILDFVLDNILTNTAGKRAKAIRSLIPANPRKLQAVKDAGGTFAYRNRDMVKSRDWLQRNGICIDDLQMGPSTIPDVAPGYGVTASRDFAEGEILTVSPLLFIADEEVLAMYQIISKTVLEDDEETETREKTTVYEYNYDNPQIGQQMLMNYAYGHAQSSVLLVPTAPVVNLINHASEGFEANAYVDWSDHPNMPNTYEYLQLSVEDLRELDSGAPLLVMKVVASRDIKKGEEILIDYGTEWENEWNNYKQTFEETYPRGKWPVKAEDVLLKYENSPYPVGLTTEYNPYPPNVITACYIQAQPVGDGVPKYDENDNEIMQWTGPKTLNEYDGHILTVCDLMSRKVDNTHGFLYTVKAQVLEKDGTATTEELQTIHGVPHAAITLFDRPYTADLHTPNAFRRWISFPDERFPQTWRNLRS